MSVTDFQIVSSELYLIGNNLQDVQSVTGSGSNLTNYTFQVSTKSKLFVSIKALHTSGVPLQLVSGQTYKLKLNSASSTHEVNISIPANPAGMIVAFETACPAGWAPSVNAQGRFLVGAGSGNTDINGAPLTARTAGQSGGLEYTTGIMASSQDSVFTVPGPGRLISRTGIDTSGFFTPQLALYQGPPDTSLAGPSQDSNLPPYATVVYCEEI